MTSDQVHCAEAELQSELQSKVSETLRLWKASPPHRALSRSEQWRYRMLFRQFRERPVPLVRWAIGTARWLVHRIRG